MNAAQSVSTVGTRRFAGRAALVRELRRWGLPGALAVLILAASGWVALLTLPQLRDDLQAEERGLAAARVAIRPHRRLHGHTSADPARDFVTSFAAASQRHRRITDLLELAARLGLQARRGDVRSQPVGESGLQRVQISMPLEGRYEDLRRYLDEALRQDTGLSLDAVRMERRDVQSPTLQADVQWSLWMQPEAAAGESEVPRVPQAQGAR